MVMSRDFHKGVDSSSTKPLLHVRLLNLGQQVQASCDGPHCRSFHRGSGAKFGLWLKVVVRLKQG
jgi:hypothetical protein